jgi:hypothetical protein
MQNILRLALFLACVLTATDPATAKDDPVGFQQLFNGRDLTGWKHSGNWKVADGVIVRDGKGGSLTYTAAQVPDDFELRFEWRVGPGSNSGVYYRPSQYEYQILDNSRHRDGQNPRTSAASLYFCMAPTHDATRPPGEWNTGRIVCQGTVIQHWLNGEKVVDFDYTDPRWAENVELLRQRGGDLTARGADLSLQDHGDPVAYRNIRWRAIPMTETVKSDNLTPAAITPEVRAAEQAKLRSIIERRNQAKNRKK